MKQVMQPCPFCGGPPSPVVVKARYLGGGTFEYKDIPEEGFDAEGFVFCHECGAEGPHAEMVVYDEGGCLELQGEGVDLWVNRNLKHACLYDAERATYEHHER